MKKFMIIAILAVLLIITGIFYQDDFFTKNNTDKRFDEHGTTIAISPTTLNSINPLNKQTSALLNNKVSNLNVSPQKNNDSEQVCLTLMATFTQTAEFEACAQSLMRTSQAQTLDKLRQLFTHWLSINWQQALNYLLTIKAEYQDYLLGDLLIKISIDDFRGALSWVEQQNFTREQQFEFISAIYLTLAKDDPISAIYDAESIANTDLKSYVVDSILAFWGQHEPLSAIAWIDQRERPDFYTQIKAQLILLLIEISPSSASEYILNMPTSEMKYHSISQYAHSLTLIDIDQALNWVAMIDENEAYQAALTPILELAASLPDYQMRALEIALEQKDQAFRDTLIESLSIQLAAVNIDAVINVHAQLPDSVNKTVTGIIAQQLLEHNINEAKNWINSLPINNSSDYAKRIIGEHLMSTDWQGSLKIAEEISNPVERFSLIEQTILYINQKNPSQAQMLLDKLPDLTNDEITRLKNQLQNNN